LRWYIISRCFSPVFRLPREFSFVRRPTHERKPLIGFGRAITGCCHLSPPLSRPQGADLLGGGGGGTCPCASPSSRWWRRVPQAAALDDWLIPHETGINDRRHSALPSNMGHPQGRRPGGGSSRGSRPTAFNRAVGHLGPSGTETRCGNSLRAEMIEARTIPRQRAGNYFCPPAQSRGV